MDVRYQMNEDLLCRWLMCPGYAVKILEWLRECPTMTLCIIRPFSAVKTGKGKEKGQCACVLTL